MFNKSFAGFGYAINSSPSKSNNPIVETVTVWVVVSAPQSSVTINVTVYVLFAENVWFTFCVVYVVPSPISQLYVVLVEEVGEVRITINEYSISELLQLM